MNLARLHAALLDGSAPSRYVLVAPCLGVGVARPLAGAGDVRGMCRYLRSLGWRAYVAEAPARVVVLGETPTAGHWVMPDEQIANLRASLAYLRGAGADRRLIRDAERQLAGLEEQERRGELKPLYDDGPALP